MFHIKFIIRKKIIINLDTDKVEMIKKNFI